LDSQFYEKLVNRRLSSFIQTEDESEVFEFDPKLSELFRAGFRSIMVVPLISKDQVIGILHIHSLKLNAYKESDLKLAERVGNQIAGAIANAELFAERKRAEEQLRKSEETARQLSQENAIVAEIGRIVSSTLNIDDVYERFAEKLRELIPIDRIAVSSINFKDNRVTISYVTGLHVADRLKGESIPLAGTIAEEILRTRTSMLIKTKDVKKFIDRFPTFSYMFQAGIRSMIAIPLISKDEVMGILHIQSTNPDGYSEKDLRLAERVGNQISGAVANAQLFKERQQAEEAVRESEETARQLSRENAIMADIGRIISSTLNIDDVYKRFADKVRELISFDRIGVYTINVRDQTFTISYVTGLDMPGRVKGTIFPLSGTLTEEIMHTRTSIPIRTEDMKKLIDRFPGLSSIFQAGIRSLVAIPLISHDEVIGTLHFQSTNPNNYSEEDLRLGERVGSQIAGAFANAGLFMERQRAEEQLISSQEQLRALSAHLQSIREEERTLVAREIHDELGQELTGLKMDLSWLIKRLPAVQEQLVNKVESMLKLIDTTIQSVRRISTKLRPGVLDDLGLTAAIEWQTQDFQNRTGIQCEFNSTLIEVDLDRDRSTAVFRTLQETLTNVTRHASATRVNIYLGKKDASIVLIVEDNGKGITRNEIFDPKSLGLLGMRERALVFGGKVEIKGKPGKGTTVTLRIPLQK
jgi:signal transduction histidine kinase